MFAACTLRQAYISTKWMLKTVNRGAVDRDGDGGKTWRQTGATGKTSLPTGKIGSQGRDFYHSSGIWTLAILFPIS